MTPKNAASRAKLDVGYWERMASKYDDEIFDSLQHDKSRVILQEIRKSRRRGGAIADMGCGIGKYLPVLGRMFDEVAGYDSSQGCVDISRKKMAGKANIAVGLASSALPRGRGRFDVVLCVNVLLDPVVRARSAITRTLVALMAPGGRLILVVPSLESAMLLAEAEADESKGKRRSGKPYWDVAKHDGGIVAIGGVPTKHFSGQELRAAVAALGLAVRRVKRVEYSWQSHSLAATRKLRGKRPWDWIVVADRAVSS